MRHPVLRLSQTIAAYVASDQEIDIHPWFEHIWKKNQCCYVPVMYHNHPLHFASYHAQTVLKPNSWHILEPMQKNHLISPSALDAVLMPVVAFDPKGNRLGRGKGCYDRSFSFLRTADIKKKPYLIGLAYEFQRIRTVHPKPWDIPLQEVITEKAWYHFLPTTNT